MKQGLVYIFEGNGKGKTSAALGTAMRMLLLGKNVVWISWYKEKSWKMAEMSLSKKFKNNLEMYWKGNGFFGGPNDHDTLDGHRKAAKSALLLAKNCLVKKEGGRGIKPDLLVLDEIIKAENDGLLKIEEILDLIKMRGGTHLLLTGHCASEKIIEAADLVTLMTKVKHPYDKGVLAVRGLDF